MTTYLRPSGCSAYPTERKDATLKDGMVTCRQGAKATKFLIGQSTMSEQALGELAAEIKNNPEMVANVMCETGIGDYAEITIPLWKYLTSYEKRRIKRAVYLYNKGDKAQLAVENDGVTDLSKIIHNVHVKALAIPREKRLTAKGVSYRTPYVKQGNQGAYGPTIGERRT